MVCSLCPRNLRRDNMRQSLLSLAVVLIVAVSSATAQGAVTVWSALVMANNRPEPTPIPTELAKLEGTLKQFFGYNQYEVIGQSRETLKTGEEDWQASSKYFSLHVNSQGVEKGAYRLNLKLLQ